jgi:hypothetical protein
MKFKLRIARGYATSLAKLRDSGLRASTGKPEGALDPSCSDSRTNSAASTTFLPFAADVDCRRSPTDARERLH